MGGPRVVAMRVFLVALTFLVLGAPVLAAPSAGVDEATPLPAATAAPESTPHPPDESPVPADATPAPADVTPQTGEPPVEAPAPSPTPRPRKARWSVDGEMRVLGEAWNWFRPAAGYENDYAYPGIRLRGRLRYKNAGFSGLVELQDNQLIGLPTRAIAPAPQGQLGLGGAYYAVALRPSINVLGVRQANIRVGQPDRAQFQAGRMEYASGAEVALTDDEVLEWLKRARIRDRLIGTFDFSNFGRTFDGARLDVDGETDHVTGFVAWPTQGGFEPHFATEITRVRISDVAWTLKRSPRLPEGEGQVFWVHYDDVRNVGFVDNRPLPRRGTVDGQGGIHFDTYGFHFITRLGEQCDALAWYAHQTGKWGALTHNADAYAVELGFRPKDVPLTPWFRVGHSHFSGDPDPTDTRHNTFYAPLPTVRLYARFPFFNLMNLDDSYAQLLFVPWKGGFARFDAHALSLANAADLWYVGAGATQNQGVMGIAGRPSGGASGLATLLDFSIEHALDKHQSLMFYYGYASGGKVIRNDYPRGGNGSVIFLEYLLRLP